MVVSQFNGTSTPKGSYRARTGDNDCNSAACKYSNGCNVISGCYSLRTTVWELHCLRIALCESIRYHAKSEQNVRQDLIPSVGHGEAALSTPLLVTGRLVQWSLALACSLVKLLSLSPTLTTDSIRYTYITIIEINVYLIELELLDFFPDVTWHLTH